MWRRYRYYARARYLSDWNHETDEISRFCGYSLRRLSDLCKASDAGKQAVAQQVKSISCTGRDASAAESYSLSAGVLQITIDNKRANSHDYEWYQSHLGATLKDDEKWAHVDRVIGDELRDLNSACETKWTMDLDKKSFAQRDPKYLEPGQCERMIYSLKRACSDSDLRARIAKGVKSLRCYAGKSDASTFEGVKTACWFTSWVTVADMKLPLNARNSNPCSSKKLAANAVVGMTVSLSVS